MNKQLLPKHKVWVLETIDLIRMRKARPDFDRISRMLLRHYGLSANETRETLEALAGDGKINVVHFKGNVSYRRCLALPEKRSPDQNAQSTSNRIIHAIKVITKQTGDGVTFDELQQWLISKNPDTRLVKHRLQNALQREIAANKVTKLSDDCYVLTSSLPKSEKGKELKPIHTIATPKNKSERSKNVLSETSTHIKSEDGESNLEKSEIDIDAPQRARPLSKRKKFKKTHGPDFEDPMTYRKVSGKDGSKDEDVTCDFCSRTAKSNREGRPEPLLTCKDCNAKAHPSCMDYSEDLARQALNSPWQCMECKTCCVCDGSDHAEIILFCDACDKGYHMTCHSPSMASKPKGKWVCSPCKKRLAEESKKGPCRQDAGSEGSLEEDSDSRKGRKRKQSLDRSGTELKRQCSRASSSSTQAENSGLFTDGTVGAPSLPTPSASPRPSDTFDYEMKMAQQTERLMLACDGIKYEDASDWSIDSVVRFFTDNGHNEQAHVFKDQEIDGPSLLLMRRNDVLTALGLKLGPALKIYQKILRLQQHSQSSSVS